MRSEPERVDCTGSVKAILSDLDHTLYDRDATFLAWARWFVRERLGPAGRRRGGDEGRKDAGAG